MPTKTHDNNAEEENDDEKTKTQNKFGSKFAKMRFSRSGSISGPNSTVSES